MKISIITVTYNRAQLIEETIQSVQSQTYADFEHIVVDDGSTDDTATVVKSFVDSRIRYFKHPKCGNLSVLHNYGISKATGEVIALLDSDDLWLPDKLESLVCVFHQNPDVKCIVHNIEYFKADKINEPYYKNTVDVYANMLREVLTFKILPFPILVFKKEILDHMTYLKRSFPDGQQDFLFRLAAQHKLFFIGRSLTRIRLHETNMHRTIKNIPYFTNYYRTVPRLFWLGKVPFGLFAKGMYLNTVNLCKHLVH